SFQVVSPVFQRTYDCQHFLIVDVIASFGGGRHGLRHKCIRMYFSVRSFLGEDCSIGVSGCIGFQKRRLIHIMVREDRSCYESFFQEIERFLTFSVPFPRDIFLEEIRKGTDDLGEVLDEASVKVRES
ncbi:hypothetical protein M407DRAFT_86452, partial [Tulasnella calospora MUT 4182]